MKSKIVALSAVVTAMSLSFAAPVASAVDVGVGAGITGGEWTGGTVYVPIRFANWKIEPELTFAQNSEDTTYPATPVNNSEYESSDYTLGAGVYWRQPVGNSLETYVGGRIGYWWGDSSATYPNNPTAGYSQEDSGFYIGPTLGAEYFFNKQFSIGLDVSLIYRSGTYDYTSVSGTAYSSDRDNLYTEARTALRYYFGQP